jgi:hypothetical protein
MITMTKKRVPRSGHLMERSKRRREEKEEGAWRKRAEETDWKNEMKGTKRDGDGLR